SRFRGNDPRFREGKRHPCGSRDSRGKTSQVTFLVPAREVSIYRGQRNQNITQLKQVWNLDTVAIIGIPVS
ncbi:MAG: hypothetical protein QME64_11225, partial [bacterium]|nr:hypothetical protein [bacterium]